jgi:thiamine pyrophosphate-dependent acetolactate synthase large subunit-like protein
MDYHVLPAVDMMISADADSVVASLVEALGSPKPKPRAVAPMPPMPVVAKDKLYVAHIAASLRKALDERDTCLAYLPISWDGSWWPLRHPLDCTGSSGGGGVGAGPGVAVGVALALKGSGRIPVAIVGDGDFMMGCTAIWTAAHYRIPLLVIAANNRSFYNDEVHQERVARMRNRPVENKWIGQRINDPDIDIAKVAEGQGARGFGPVTRVEDLDDVIARAVAAVDAGQVAVIDVRIEPGYLEEVSAAMLRKT